MPDPDALLTVTGLTRRYGALAAVDGLDLTVRRGARHALLGPNGAGKSTVLGMIAGAIPVTSGSIVFGGRDITRLAPPAAPGSASRARSNNPPWCPRSPSWTT